MARATALKESAPDPGMNVTGLSKPYSTALSIDTIPNFLLAWLNKASLLRLSVRPTPPASA